MKLNASTALSTPKVLLVPYSAHHVPTYHEWMQDPELQAATASEPLTLDEEYAMQRSWREDRDKLTFIVCLPLDSSKDSEGGGVVWARADDVPEKMIGDINLFLFQADDGDDEAANATIASRDRGVVGEIELMIARRDFRRQGYGRAALLTFLSYVLRNWPAVGAEYLAGSLGSCSRPEGVPLRYLRVKIQQSNAGSIKLFESIGFHRIGEGANYFGEVELRWRPEDDADGLVAKLKEVRRGVKEVRYDESSMR